MNLLSTTARWTHNKPEMQNPTTERWCEGDRPRLAERNCDDTGEIPMTTSFPMTHANSYASGRTAVPEQTSIVGQVPAQLPAITGGDRAGTSVSTAQSRAFPIHLGGLSMPMTAKNHCSSTVSSETAKHFAVTITHASLFATTDAPGQSRKRCLDQSTEER